MIRTTIFSSAHSCGPAPAWTKPLAKLNTSVSCDDHGRSIIHGEKIYGTKDEEDREGGEAAQDKEGSEVAHRAVRTQQREAVEQPSSGIGDPGDRSAGAENRPMPTAAAILGIDQPTVSALKQGKLSGFSIERLMRLLLRLGRDVEITVKSRSRAGLAKLRVA